MILVDTFNVGTCDAFAFETPSFYLLCLLVLDLILPTTIPSFFFTILIIFLCINTFKYIFEVLLTNKDIGILNNSNFISHQCR